MVKKTLVFLAEGFEEIEAVTVVDILRRAGIEVTIAGLGGIMIKGSRGVTIQADTEIDGVRDDFDACVLPGGDAGAKNLAASEKIKAILRDMNAKGRLIAAICASPAVVLAPAGLLKNKKATCYPGMGGEFKQNTSYVEDSVVIDGNIITSRGPGTALAFSLAIVEKLSGEEITVNLKKVILFE